MARVSAKLNTITDRPDFLAAARARRVTTPGFVLQALERPCIAALGPATAVPSGAAPVRVGFTCSKKVGNAVARNRAKRRLRAAARIVIGAAGRPGWDYVLIGRARETAARPFDRLTDDLRDAMARAHR